MRKKQYRQGVNCIIVDKDNQFLVIQLQQYGSHQWKFVGGGIEVNESVVEAAYREIREETNILRSDLTLIGESKHIQQYDFPKELKITKKFKGQKKHQFVFQFIGNKNSIVIQQAELKNYKWIPKKELKKYLVFLGQFENAQKIITEFSL
ncbi:MAG: NUDIX domain-containing protein [Patescibacteria group bacterium]|nr:NUDIX domain-containing protein [Patescibacteria group bacterium]